MNKVIEITTEQELKTRFEQLAHVLHNLRFFTKYWNEHGGAHARSRMHHWQQKADTLLNEMGHTLHNNITAIKLIKY